MTRADLPEFVRLLRATEDEAATTDGGKVAVVASSLTISQTMFTTADRSLREPLFRRERITITTEVDRVSRLPYGILPGGRAGRADPAADPPAPGNSRWSC